MHVSVCSAPGKIVLFGEYCVLEGWPALVCAYPIRAHVAQNTTSPLSDLHACIQIEASNLGYPNQAFSFQADTQFFYQNHEKRGLGSSAAACVALSAAYVAPHIKNIDDIFKLAIKAHQKWSLGLGSGIDIAASCFGGALSYCHPDNFYTLPKNIWPYLESSFLVIDMGFSQCTKISLQTLSEYKKEHPKIYTSLMDALGQISSDLFQALHHQKPFFELLDAFSKSLKTLQKKSGLNIWTPKHDWLFSLAKTHKCSIKPCGAGGGDLALAYGDAGSLIAFKKSLQGYAMKSTFLQIDPKGVVYA